MTRWLVAALATGLLAMAAVVGVRRLLGRPGARQALLTPVVAQWLGAYVIWTFTGGLLVRSGVLGVYDGPYFLILALAGGAWQYRALRAGAREPALAIFVGLQLLWLLVVLLRNGLLSSI